MKRMLKNLTVPSTIIFFVTLSTISYSQPDQYSAPEKNWFTIETKHFTVNFHEGEERTAKIAAKIAEEIYEPITSLYQHELDEKVNLYFKDISDYSNGAAYFFNNKIEIWASPLDFELRGTHNWLRNVISHEFTHIVQIQSAMKFSRSFPALSFQWLGYERERRTDVLYGYPNVLISYPFPGVTVAPWMAEGTAQYMRREFGYEDWDSHRDMILRSYVLSDSMLTWADMSAFGKTSLGNESVYNSGYNLIRYIAKTYGEQKIAEITKALSSPFVFSVDAAFEKTLEKSGRELYAEWAAQLKEEYSARIAPVLKNSIEGNLIASVGFGNFYPTFSPDGKKIAYISNKESDYFGQSAIYIYDVAAKKETLLIAGVRSALSWSPDGKMIVYSKYNSPSVYGHLYYDLYQYDLIEKEEKQLTYNLRAHNPSFSSDGKEIAFVYGSDGNVNIAVVKADGSGFTPITKFKNGEQALTPKWSPDGLRIVFGYAPRVQRQIAMINRDGTGFEITIADSSDDVRDPVISADGTMLYFAADRNGIFNIYSFDLASKEVKQYTNVTGGAFMPSINKDGMLAFASYHASGYKISSIDSAAPVQSKDNDYLPAKEWVPNQPTLQAKQFDWERLRNYDDMKIPDTKVKPYRTIFSDMMFFPYLRIDQYNPKNTGIELLKPGVFMFSNDVLNRLELLAGAAINIKFERDLFLSLTYRDKIPILSNLGIYPDVTLEVFNITRKTNTTIDLPLDTIPVDVNFNLFEFNGYVRHNIFNNNYRLEVGFRHSRYSSGLGNFVLPEVDQLVKASDNLYYIGNDASITIRYKHIQPARDAEINPVGRHVTVRYDYEFNRFNSTGDYDIEDGLLVPKYTHYNFHRLEVFWTEGIRLPGWRHALSLRLRGGTIFGSRVDDFFNFYAGGIIGMQGYTFYALGGNHIASATLTYRAPIVGDIGWKVGHILFDKLYGSVFADVGDAWTNEKKFFSDLKKDIGFEIRLQAFSFYMYPTSIFFSGAYGLDQFTRTFNNRDLTYGKEWRFYFGILFGFDLTDGTQAMRMR